MTDRWSREEKKTRSEEEEEVKRRKEAPVVMKELFVSTEEKVGMDTLKKNDHVTLKGQFVLYGHFLHFLLRQENVLIRA